MYLQPESEEFTWTGEPTHSANAGMLYGYYFSLLGEHARHANIEATLNHQALPEWLHLERVDDGHFLLSGVPPKGTSGTPQVEISVDSNSEGMNLHTQQAYRLSIVREDHTLTRASGIAAVTSESRKAKLDTGAEQYAAMFEMQMSEVNLFSMGSIAHHLYYFSQQYLSDESNISPAIW